MNQKKIHVVLGTKAQLIKMAPIMAELQKRGLDYNFIFTGQHQETIKELRENFGIKRPDITLHKGKDITGILQMLFWLIKICSKVMVKRKKIFGKTGENDVLLTHGDTFSTLLGALMGKLARMKIGHVESGLRSFNIWHPFPEELTRILTFHLSDYYFCPGKWAENNLQKFKGKKINTELNTLYDALQLAKTNFDKSKVEIPKEKYAVCSIHRFENIFNQKRFKHIIHQIIKVSKTIKTLFILHPPTIKQLKKYDFYKKLEKEKSIELRPRYDYLDFTNLVYNSEFIITDGGSNQEEAFYMGKPCLIMRETTEREEGLGKNALVSKYSSKTIEEFVENYNHYRIGEISKKQSPSKIIIETISK